MADSEQVYQALQPLKPGQLDLLLEMATCMSKEIVQKINPHSDILSSEFTENFSNRLLIHHATHEEKFKKKSFEFAFRSASNSAGRKANIVSSPTNPGADVIVDGVKFSLKTEASASISLEKITISKLMEARWIRDCTTKADFARNTTTRVVQHLQKYDRILMLRAFDVPDSQVRYDLVEIPRNILLRMECLTAKDFRAKTKGGGSGANIYIDEKKVFHVTLDGSVEKISISGLPTKLCKAHGSWTIPSIGSFSE